MPLLATALLANALLANTMGAAVYTTPHQVSQPPPRVLEFGGGTGLLSRQLADDVATILDESAVAIRAGVGVRGTGLMTASGDKTIASVDKLRALDNIPLSMGTDQFQALIRKEWDANGKVVREAHIQAQ